jgi:GxxExxY protein
MENILYKKEAYDIIGACLAVHNYLGHGFLEVVYKDAVEVEFSAFRINFEREREFNINYKGVILLHKFHVDFVVMDKIIVEVKSTNEGISNGYIAQTLNYLKISGVRLGLIINFGKTSLEYKRLIV